jgi:hypothetical protein
MAGFQTKTFIKHDDYMTPKSAWENIKDFIPKNKIIWEAFYGNGQSGKFLEELGFNVIHKEIDFFKSNEGEIIVSNPPFSQIKDILKRLKELDKPFIIIMPCSKIHTSYLRNNFKNNNDIQLIIPRKRIQFEKYKDNKKIEGIKSKCNFDCFYYCYKINLMHNITYLE